MADRLVLWKPPRYLVVRDDPLPRLPNGKLDRVALGESLDLGRAWDAWSGAGPRGSHAAPGGAG